MIPAQEIGITSFSTAAKLAYESGDGDLEESTEILRAMVKNNVAIHDEVVESAVVHAVRQQMHRQRAKYFPSSSVPSEPKEAKDALIRDAEERLLKWFDYRLSKGERLGDVSKMRLKDEASMHYSLSCGNLVKERLFTAIAKLMPNNKVKVHECVTEDQIENIAHGE